MWVGLVGSNGAGKSVACNYLATLGYAVVSLSDEVREAARAEGLSTTRDNLIQMGSALKAEFGPDVLAKRSMAKAKGQEKVVFDSIRHPTEAQLLKQNGVFLLGIDAPIELRYNRIKARQKDTDQVSFEEFKAQDERENQGQSSGQNIFETLKCCDVILKNGVDIAAFYTQLSQTLTQNNLHRRPQNV